MSSKHFILIVAAAVLAAIVAGVVMFRAELSTVRDRRQRQADLSAARCGEAVKEIRHLTERAELASAGDEACRAEELFDSVLSHIDSAVVPCPGISADVVDAESRTHLQEMRDRSQARCRGGG